MAYSDIEEESRLLSTLSSDIDKFRNKYTTYELQTNGKKVNITFVSPSLLLFDRYRFYILQNSNKKKLSLKNRYRPDYVSYEEYGTTNWWALILYINDVPSLEYFDKDEILVPTMDCILKLMDVSSEIKQINTLNQDDLKTTTSAILYSPPVNNIGSDNGEFANKEITVQDTVKELLSAYQLDNAGKVSPGGSTSNYNSDLEGERFRRETFVMDIPTLRLRYVDLDAVPIENSIILSVKYKTSFVYGKHYKLIESKDNVYNRITWDPRVVSGSGLVFRLKEDDIVQISYVTKL